MLSTELKSLHGRVVLVRAASDPHFPETGMRGHLEVRDSPEGESRLSLALDFPQMFQTRAHHRTILLSDGDVARLLASERNGAFEFTLENGLK